MPSIDTLEELLKHELKDLYSAETQIIDALPNMIEGATNADLKNALEQHLTVTKTHKERLDKIQQLLGEESNNSEKKGFFANLFKSKEGEEHCKAMEGLIKEGDSLINEDMSFEVMDAAIIAAAQKIEHYEISSYGTARAYALQLRLNQVAKLLESTLQEEYEANNSLSALALSKINLDAEGELQMLPNTNKKPPKKKAKTAKKASPKKAAKKSSPKKQTSKTKTAKNKK